MPTHKSAEKRVRQNQKRKLHNKYYAKTVRNAVKKFRNITSQEEAEKRHPHVASMIDKLAKRKVIHKNKASNLKSTLSHHLNQLKEQQ